MMDRSKLLLALEEDHNGNWETAHDIVQTMNSREACWIHAYLHRKEGDIGNAGYWYSRAGKPMSTKLLDEEWNELFDTVSSLDH